MKPRSSSTLRVFQTDVLRVGLAAHRHQQLFRLQVFLLAVPGGERQPHAGAGLFDVLRARAGFHANALLAEIALEFLGDVLVLHRNHARQHFDDRDFGAEAAEDGGELDAHRARADDDQALRHRRQVEDFDVGENEFRVGLQAGKHAGFRAGGDDDVLRLQSLGAGCSTVTSTLPPPLSVA